MHVDLLRDLVHRQRPQRRHRILLEDVGLRVDDGLRDVLDRVLPVLDRLPQRFRRADVFADVAPGFGWTGRILQHLDVLAGNVDFGDVAVQHARPPFTALRPRDEDFRTDVDRRLFLRRESTPRHRFELPQLGEHLLIFFRRDVQRAADQRLAVGRRILEVLVDQQPDLILPRRIVEFLHLRQQHLARIASPAAHGIELLDLAQDGEDAFLLRLQDHLDVRQRFLEVAVVVDVLDQQFGERTVRIADVRIGNLLLQVFLERLLLDLAVEHGLAPGLRVGIHRAVFGRRVAILHVLEIVVAIRVIA